MRFAVGIIGGGQAPAGAILPNLLSFADPAFPSPTLTGAGQISPALLSFADPTFPAPSLVANIIPTLLTFADPAFPSPTLAGSATIAPDLLTFADPTFPAPELTGADDVVKLDDWFVAATAVASPGSHTPSAGSDRVLLYFASARSGTGEQVTAVTYGGESMTEVESAFAAGAGADVDGSLWILDEAGIQAAASTAFGITGPVAVNTQYRAFVAVFDLVDQTTPVLDSFVATGINSATPTAEAMTTDVGGYALGFLCTRSASADAGWTTMTQQIEEQAGDSYQSIADDPTTGANVTPTLSPSGLVNSTLIGLSLRKA